MESRRERVVVETERHRIIGDLTLPREGHRSRLSDFLNRGDVDFIALVDVEVHALGEEVMPPERREFIAVARGHIQLVYPVPSG
jgi:hypothetical protein